MGEIINGDDVVIEVGKEFVSGDTKGRDVSTFMVLDKGRP